VIPREGVESMASGNLGVPESWLSDPERGVESGERLKIEQ
jgi:hypothetical protein